VWDNRWDEIYDFTPGPQHYSYLPPPPPPPQQLPFKVRKRNGWRHGCSIRDVVVVVVVVGVVVVVVVVVRT